MNMLTGTIEIRRWTVGAHVEPGVRIGVVLEEDGCDSIELVLPGEACVVTGEGGGRTGGETGVGGAAMEAGGTATVRRSGGGVRVDWAGGSYGPVDRLRIGPKDRMASAPGAGITAKGVTAGRGFHWQKQVDQTLVGTLEFVAFSGGMVMVNELPLEDYLAGVITAEMSGSCPVEFLKAQCVVARSWLLAMTEPKHADDPFDRCNDDCCQRYQGTGDMSQAAIDAAVGTRGRVLLAPGDVVLDANYSKSCGGISEKPEAVWGMAKPGLGAIVDAPGPGGDPVSGFMPVTEDNLDDYLDGDWLKDTRAYCSTHVVPVQTIGKYLGRVDEVDDYFRWTVSYTREQLESLLRQKLPEAGGLVELRGLRVLSRGVSGRASGVELSWVERGGGQVEHVLDSEYRIRQVLHTGFLYSSAFACREERDGEGKLITITLRGAGWGHGAGLCQIGALGMALCGHDCEIICRHYFPEAKLETVYP